MTPDRKNIQRAHDVLLTFLITPELKHGVDRKSLEVINASAGVLCWVLGHSGSSFEGFVEALETLLRFYGYTPPDPEKGTVH